MLIRKKLLYVLRVGIKFHILYHYIVLMAKKNCSPIVVYTLGFLIKGGGKKMIVFEHDVECYECKGTGIYKGCAERGGAGVVCQRCKGTGMIHIKHTYEPFIGRKIHPNVNRVYQTSARFIITDEDTELDGKVFKFSEAGVSYADWLEGKNPKPIKELHCPLQHFIQGTPIGEFLKEKGPCRDKLRLDISKCAEKHKEECWEYYSKNKIMLKEMNNV